MSARRIWTAADIKALGVRTDLVTACKIVYGVGKDKAWAMYRAGELDFPTLTVSHGRRRVVVPTVPLLKLLSLDEGEAAA